MRIALIQMSMSQTFDENVEKTMGRMREAAVAGAELVCFPEIQLSPFFPQYSNTDASRYLVDMNHSAMNQIRGLCRDLRIVAFPNVYLAEGDARYDATPAVDADGTILGVSKMVHIVQAPCFYEQDYYTPSDTGFRVYEKLLHLVL